MSNIRGLFVVFEGIDASGKSTQAKMLHRYLTRNGYRARLTKEPTDGETGKLLRKALGGRIRLDPRTLALLFAADRVEHVKKVIEPEIRRGKIVISDRYYHSSLVYQSLSCEVEWVKAINKYAIKPDVVFYVDIPPEESTKRMGNSDRKRRKEIFEREALQEKIRAGYLSVLEQEDIILIDGMQSAEGVHSEVVGVLKSRRLI